MLFIGPVTALLFTSMATLPYPWILQSNGTPNAPGLVAERYNHENSILARIPTPAGFARTRAPEDSFASWLRGLPLKPGRPPVLLYNGKPKANQNAHAMVIDIDVGRRDLQQCADAVMRLRAEHQWSTAKRDAIQFNFTSGHTLRYAHWAQGFRPHVEGSKVNFQKTRPPTNTYQSFRQYLDNVFMYAGSYSLEKELERVSHPAQVLPGDVYIQGGFPGHAVIVLDVAENASTGVRLMLLGQSYMPAQEMHVLKNPNGADMGPWYEVHPTAKLVTPEWTFLPGDLRRFPRPPPQNNFSADSD